MKGRKKFLDWEHYREKKAYVQGTGQPMPIGKHVCEELQVTRRKQKRKNCVRKNVNFQILLMISPALSLHEAKLNTH